MSVCVCVRVCTIALSSKIIERERGRVDCRSTDIYMTFFILY